MKTIFKLAIGLALVSSLTGCKLVAYVTGLKTNDELVLLEENTGTKLTVNRNGSSLFREHFESGTDYRVSVVTQPASTTHCEVIGGEGTFSGLLNLVKVKCEEPGPVFCTDIYDPVCTKISTPVTCVTTPCPTHAYKTFGNGCYADKAGAQFAFAGECGTIEGPASNPFKPAQIVSPADIPEYHLAARARIQDDTLIMIPNQPLCDERLYGLYIDETFRFIDVYPATADVFLATTREPTREDQACRFFAPVLVRFDLKPLQAFLGENGGSIYLNGIGYYRYGDQAFSDIGDRCGGFLPVEWLPPPCAEGLYCRYENNPDGPVIADLPGVCWPVDNTTEDLLTRKETLNDAIQILVEDKSCDDTQQCRSIGYGSKPCGGPASYLIYSSKTIAPDSSRQWVLQAAVDEYNTLSQLYNEQEGLVSDCSVTPSPTLSCVQHRCEATANTSSPAQ